MVSIMSEAAQRSFQMAWRSSQVDRLATDILIVGAGPAGLAAAAAASATPDASIALVDDNPNVGGQIWRAELGKNKHPDAVAALRLIDDGRVRVLTRTQVFARSDEQTLFASTADAAIELQYSKLILATGAREMFLPFPGWTLPGVYGAGGLQAMVKGGLLIDGRRVVIAGTGPLLLA